MTLEQLPKWMQSLLLAFRLDLKANHDRQPTITSILLATIVALVGSLVADWLLVKLGTRVFPSTVGFPHFRFSDYSKLTVIGVLIACAAWPIATRLTSTPRAFFFRAAIVITIVLFAPDAYIWHSGSSGEAVFVLIWLHVAIAIVTYNALVRLAPVPRGRHARHAAE
ncbi:MAG: hypothetical protein WA614_08935 [Acidimicrobiales bacterium]|jgi:hypothetical protein